MDAGSTKLREIANTTGRVRGLPVDFEDGSVFGTPPEDGALVKIAFRLRLSVDLIVGGVTVGVCAGIEIAGVCVLVGRVGVDDIGASVRPGVFTGLR